MSAESAADVWSILFSPLAKGSITRAHTHITEAKVFFQFGDGNKALTVLNPKTFISSQKNILSHPIVHKLSPFERE